MKFKTPGAYAKFATVITSLTLAIVTASFPFTPTAAVAQTNAARYYPPTAWILGPWMGWIGSENTISDVLTHFEQDNIPLTVFHFDSNNWETCPGSAQFKFSNALLQHLQADNLRAVFWYVPLIDLSCPDYDLAASSHYFVEDSNGQPIVTNNFTGHGSWVDFNNGAAVAWLHLKYDALLSTTIVSGTQVTGGFYIDNVRPDEHDDSAYEDAFTKDLLDYTRAHIPDGEVVMKRFGANNPDDTFLAQYGHTSYVGDLPTDFSGIADGVTRVLQTAPLLPAPFNEFSGNAYSEPDSETYIRRLHWGALQAVMDNSPAQKNFPWQPEFTPQVLDMYQYYSTLHWELVPYLHSYDQAAYETNTPIFLNMDAGRYATGLGNELFAKFITDYVTSVEVHLPRGKWINYWDETQVYDGPTKLTQQVPVGQEPIWILKGAIIPMQVRDRSTGHGSRYSVGALTVNVFPSGHSTFQYFDPENYWVTLDSTKSENTLTLCTKNNAPSQPLIYRVARWKKNPSSVTTTGGAVGVNQSWGSALALLDDEQAVESSSGGWYYDSTKQHLIIKVTALGTDCPS